MMMRRFVNRIVETSLRVLTALQRLSGIRYPASPHILWARLHAPELFVSTDVEVVREKLKFVTLGLLCEDAFWNLQKPSNSHQYTRLIGDIHVSECLDPAELFTRAVKIHYGITHLSGDHDVERLEEEIRNGFASRRKVRQKEGE